MQFQQGAEVLTADGKVLGRVERVVMDPRTKAVTDLVIRKGTLLTEDKVAPVDSVDSTTENTVVLRQKADEVGKLLPFEETQYVPAVGIDYQAEKALPLFVYPPIGTLWPKYPRTAPGQVFIPETKRNIPMNAVALKEGAAVISVDGERVGHVKRILTDPTHDIVTHLVISQGLLPKTQKLIPSIWIKTVTDEHVYLAVEARLLESLQAFEP